MQTVGDIETHWILKFKDLQLNLEIKNSDIISKIGAKAKYPVL
jgi:hypothetical protein